MSDLSEISSERQIASRTMREPIRVLIVHNTYQQQGGEDRVVEEEIKLLQIHGHEVRIFSRDNKSIAANRVIPLFINALWSREGAADIRTAIQSFRPEVIHVHNTFPLISPSIYWAAAAAKVPVIQTLHNFRLLCPQAMFLRDDKVCEDCLGKLPWRAVAHRCYRGSAPQSATAVAMLGLHRSIGTFQNKVSRYIALSEFAKAKFVGSKQITADQIAVKPNFVDVERVDRFVARRGALIVGRLSREKGIHVLAAAMDKISDCEIDVIGTGPEQVKLEGQRTIRLLGWQEKRFIYDKMRAAKYLLLPSICYENFPRTLVEAFACGLPVIASRLGALPELLEDGYNGLLFTPGSPDDLASKIAWAEAHPDSMAEMGRNARTTYEAKYTADKNYVHLLQIYTEAIAANGRVPIATIASQQT